MTIQPQTLLLVHEDLAISRLDPGAPIPDWASGGGFLSITRTAEELSIICPQESVPPDVRSDKGWRALKVQGPLPFDIIGLLASLSSLLAEEGIPIFVVSTFDTDFVLIKGERLPSAMEALQRAGHQIIVEPEA